MAIKGLAYTKTTWAFEERPVASSKLNSWDDRIEAALEIVHFFLAQAWGGGDGVLRAATANDLEVQATSPTSLSVEVQPGYGFIAAAPYKLASATQTADIAPPTSQPRIDLVVARLATWDIAIKTGTEDATPTAPTPDADTIPLAQLYLRPGMSTIKDADDATNGYITDARNYL